MKSRKELKLDSELQRMRQRSFEERCKSEYQQFVDAELLENAKSRLDPKWRTAWDRFHDVWSTRLLPKKAEGKPGRGFYLKHGGK